MSCTLAYECVDPRCENLTNCLLGVNSLTNTIVRVNTIVEIFTPSLFLYCFANLTFKDWLSQSLIFYKQVNKEYTICLQKGCFQNSRGNIQSVSVVKLLYAILCIY